MNTGNSNFRLIETMRVSEHGDVDLLERHLRRLANSASHFGFECDPAKIRAQVTEAALLENNPASLRLLLAPNAVTTVTRGHLPNGYVRHLKLSRGRVDSSDIFLQHKTTRRGVYEQAKRGCDERTDVILSNERGEITETTIMNIAVFRNGRWISPPASCGLLRGVMREEMLERGEIVEGVIRVDELQNAELVRCFNALRGVIDVPFLSSGPRGL